MIEVALNFMFEKLEEEIEAKADEYALEESTACNYGEATKHVYQGYFYGFKEGAKFGYAKANEWHSVKDGKPKDEKDMLMSGQLILLTRMKGTDNLSVSIGQYNFSMQEFSYQHIVGPTEVVAWKEIVLPELKEIKEHGV